MNILVTGGGGAGSEALDRLWRSHVVHFADADRDALPPTIAADRRHQIPMAGPAWAPAIADLCCRLSIDVLVPTVDEELPHVGAVTAIARALVPLLPPPEFVRLMKDKLESMRALAAAGIDVPRTEAFDAAAHLGLPCLVKPRDGRGSRGVQIIETVEQLAAYRTLSRRPADQIVAQELLRGEEWTVYVSADRRGGLRGIVPMRIGIKRGITVRAETVADEGVIAYCRSIQERFCVAGPFNVQLMKTTAGRIAAFEINPRVSTTLCLAVAAGADPLTDFLAADAPGALRPFTAGVRVQRNWFNHFSYPAGA